MRCCASTTCRQSSRRSRARRKIRLHGGETYAGGFTTTVIALAGYPGITVPMGFVQGLPVGLGFLGTAYSEPTLLSYAYAYEQATQVRHAPHYLATGGPPVAPTAPAQASVATVTQGRPALL